MIENSRKTEKHRQQTVGIREEITVKNSKEDRLRAEQTVSQIVQINI